jgi:ABC-2 type transport system ATP-binding protein
MPLKTRQVGGGLSRKENPMTTTAIRLDQITHDFGSVRALDHLSLQVPAGVIYGFLGPNGAGKTTTINLLLGLLEPAEGHAEVLGFDTRTHADEARSRTGALLEHTGLYEQMSAADNLEFYGRVNRMSATDRSARSKELLTNIGLWDRRSERVCKWSQGMKQKLALARAMLHRPPLLLLDEPTAGLDVMAANEVRGDLAALVQREGVTVFLTTHNMVEAEKLCAEVAVIRSGKLVAVGQPDRLRAQTSSPRVEIIGRGFDDRVLKTIQDQPQVASVVTQNHHLIIDLRGAADIAPLINRLVGAGAQIEEVRREQASLEEVFLKLMEEER